MKYTFMKSILSRGLALSLIVAAPTVSACPTHCYDLSNAAYQSYNVGSTINIPKATVEVQDFYMVPGVPVTPATQYMNIASSRIAGGDANEVHLYLVNMKLTPEQPVSMMSMKVGHNTGYQNNYLDINIEVNGQQIIIPDGFEGLDGTVIGEPGRQVTIHTDIEYPEPGPAQWVNGNLSFQGKDGAKIEYVTIGMRQGVLDNICMTP